MVKCKLEYILFIKSYYLLNYLINFGRRREHIAKYVHPDLGSVYRTSFWVHIICLGLPFSLQVKLIVAVAYHIECFWCSNNVSGLNQVCLLFVWCFFMNNCYSYLVDHFEYGCVDRVKLLYRKLQRELYVVQSY